MFGIAFFSKWLHLMSMIGILGGIGFAWTVLVPTARAKPENAEANEALWKRFGLQLRGMWAVAFLTGLYNTSVVASSVNQQYNQWLGLKVALAIVMLILSILLARPASNAARFLVDRSRWFITLMILGILIVGLSAQMNMSRVNGTGLKHSTPH